MSTDKATSFFQSYPHLRGDDLRLKLEEVVQDWKTEMTRFEFNQEAEFLEESDLTAKYKDKPEVLEKILKNGRQYFCPVKKVTLYHDPKYNAKVTDQTEFGHTEKRKGQSVLADTTAEEKLPKRPKKGQGSGPKGEADEKNKLKVGEKKKIQKKLDQVGTKVLQLSDLVTKCGNFGDMIPRYVIDAAEKGKANATKTVEMVQAALNAGHGDSAAMLAKLDDEANTLSECCARVKSQVDQAANFK